MTADEGGPIDPRQALMGGRTDATRLLWCWHVRRSCFGLLMLGVIVGTVVAGAGENAAELDLDTSSADTVLGGLLTSFGLVFLAIVVRLATGWIALALAYPLAREHQGPPAEGPSLRDRFERHTDRYSIARAFRELRWTEGVRHAALSRIGHVAVHERLDRLIGIANVAVVPLAFLAVFAFGLTVEA